MKKVEYTKQFKHWVEELISEEEGRSIALKGIIYLKTLYKDSTGKNATKSNTKLLKNKQ